MAKVYDVKCPYCKTVTKMMLSDMLGSIADGPGIRGAEEEPKPPYSESLDEQNWIDLKTPCSVCGHRFSFNIIAGESRE